MGLIKSTIKYTLVGLVCYGMGGCNKEASIREKYELVPKKMETAAVETTKQTSLDVVYFPPEKTLEAKLR